MFGKFFGKKQKTASDIYEETIRKSENSLKAAQQINNGLFKMSEQMIASTNNVMQQNAAFKI